MNGKEVLNELLEIDRQGLLSETSKVYIINKGKCIKLLDIELDSDNDLIITT